MTLSVTSLMSSSKPAASMICYCGTQPLTRQLPRTTHLLCCELGLRRQKRSVARIIACCCIHSAISNDNRHNFARHHHSNCHLCLVCSICMLQAPKSQLLTPPTPYYQCCLEFARILHFSSKTDGNQQISYEIMNFEQKTTISLQNR